MGGIVRKLEVKVGVACGSSAQHRHVVIRAVWRNLNLDRARAPRVQKLKYELEGRMSREFVGRYRLEICLLKTPAASQIYQARLTMLTCGF